MIAKGGDRAGEQVLYGRLVVPLTIETRGFHDVPGSDEVDLEAHGRVRRCPCGEQCPEMVNAFRLMSIEQRQHVLEYAQISLHEGDPVLHRLIPIFKAC